MSDYGPCPTCGTVSNTFLVPIWEDKDTYPTDDPDYVGCTECNTMRGYDE